MKKTMIVITGPTASGKTEIAISVAVHFGCEIINADSRQIYKEMSIGTAKPTPHQLKKVRHYFVSSQSIYNEYSAGEFMEDALKTVENLFDSNDLLLVSGGSGLYIDALCKGLDSFPDVDPQLREDLNRLHEKKGIQHLHELLKEKDPQYYEVVDLQNPRRLIRALEVSISSGKPYSDFRKAGSVERDFDIIKIGIETEREIIYDRINKRVDQMLKDGLAEEAKSLYPMKNLTALKTVGYKELFDYFDGKTDLETAVQMIKQNSRRYAKRQLTWFRKDKEIKWFKKEDLPSIISYIESKLRSS